MESLSRDEQINTIYKSPIIATMPPPIAAAAMGSAVAGAKLSEEPVAFAPLAPVCVAAARLDNSCDASDLIVVRAPLSFDFASPRQC